MYFNFTLIYYAILICQNLSRHLEYYINSKNIDFIPLKYQLYSLNRLNKKKISTVD